MYYVENSIIVRCELINMKKYVFPIIGFVLIVSACIGVYIYMKPSSWESYLKESLNWPARHFIVNNLKNIPSPKKGAVALDLGAGVGNDTLLLLEKGFDVIAIDSEKIAFDLMLKRPEIRKHQSHLKTVQSTFQDLNFAELPNADLIVASFSIPFCPPKYFDRFWQNLVSKIKPGGYFVGNIYSPRSRASFKKRHDKMTFHDDQQTIDLFKDFTIISKISNSVNFEYCIIFAQKKQ
jgi:tellurite methyltransferase